MANAWLTGDIQNVLQAAACAGQETARLARNKAYLEGYAACLQLLSLSFGLQPVDIIPERTTGNNGYR